MFANARVWCVVGDVMNASKVASRLGPKLASRGKEVWSVNPSSKTVESEHLKRSILDIPVEIEVVNLCIHPAVGAQVVQEAAELGVKSIFIQPGASSEDILKICDEASMTVHEGCVLREL